LTELTDLISRAHIIDPKSLPHTRVSFGSTVELVDLDDDSSVIYTIVGSQESDPTKGFISISSPMGKSLLERRGRLEIWEELNSLPKGWEIKKEGFGGIKKEAYSLFGNWKEEGFLIGVKKVPEG